MYRINFDRVPEVMLNEKLREDLRKIFAQAHAPGAIVYLAMFLAADEAGKIKMDEALFTKFINKNLDYLKTLLSKVLEGEPS